MKSSLTETGGAGKRSESEHRHSTIKKRVNEDDTIKVIIRFRGNESLNENEKRNWLFDRDGHEVEVMSANNRSGDGDGSRFTFDHVLQDVCTQERMYQCAARETVEQFTKGYNGTIFAYGESGSGKTFTMLGPEEVVETIKNGQ